MEESIAAGATTDDGDSHASWLEKPAIIWNEELVQGHASSGANGSYWESYHLLRLENSTAAEELSPIKTLSYNTVITTTAFVVNKLRSKLQEHCFKEKSCVDNNDNKPIGIPIFVAIPEGPLQSLAILAVHALNVPYYFNDEHTQIYGVLVPLEPGEGKERIRHMLQNIKAAMILCLDTDQQRLESILNTFQPLSNTSRSNGDENSTIISSQGLYRSRNTILINFMDQVKTSTSLIYEEMQHQQLSSILPRIRKYLLNDISNRPIQEIVNACSYLVSFQERSTNSTPSPIENRISHVVFTSGTTGTPKGCICSIQALSHYLYSKNKAHGIQPHKNVTVLLASSLSFDPCLSDILATFQAYATLGIASRINLREQLAFVLQSLKITHVLCTPTLWGTMNNSTLDGHPPPQPNDFPSLRVVALGGEPIPKQIVQVWARRNVNEDEYDDERETLRCRLFATYGVTEACVYQTMGEVFHEVIPSGVTAFGQNVGKPMDSTRIRICAEENQDILVDLVSPATLTNGSSCVGEVIISGAQVDSFSSYLNQQELSATKFFSISQPKQHRHQQQHMCYFYRTGDRGSIDSESGELRILGRIQGDRMIKINGVRVELGEIEMALVDDADLDEKLNRRRITTCSPLIVDAAAVAMSNTDEGDSAESSKKQEVHAYCVISQDCANQLGIEDFKSCHGIFCHTDPVLVLLQMRCKEKVRAGFTPSAFIFVSKMPLSPTGKRDLSALPKLENCRPIRSAGSDGAYDLRGYGRCGSILVEQIISCLNLQPCQQSMLITRASFGMLGGDSLAATRIVRALYALHHDVRDSRFLGGKYGTMDAPFAPAQLLSAKDLGQYVDYLDQHGVLATTATKATETSSNNDSSDHPVADPIEKTSRSISDDLKSQLDKRLYDALMKATACGQTTVAIALLDVGADPNFLDHGRRLGKVSGRNVRKATFYSSPLHLACLSGDACLVERLLEKGAKFTSPDASGIYPLQLAAAGQSSNQQGQDLVTLQGKMRRLDCVKLLLEAGAPIFMKDANKQTVLHCAARSGDCCLIKFVAQKWKEARGLDISSNDDTLNWWDHWYRK